jgi:hypothetical protein
MLLHLAVSRGFTVSNSGFQIPAFRFRVSCFGFQVSGFGFRVSCFGVQVSGFRFRVSGFGFPRHGKISVNFQGYQSMSMEGLQSRSHMERYRSTWKDISKCGWQRGVRTRRHSMLLPLAVSVHVKISVNVEGYQSTWKNIIQCLWKDFSQYHTWKEVLAHEKMW